MFLNRQISLIAVFLFCFATNVLQAQIICKTSDVPGNAGGCQQEFYDPVCGCDSVTYRHPCDATVINHVQFYTEGICLNQLFAMDIYPVPADQNNPVKLAIETRPNLPSSFSVLIYDSYGVLQLQRIIGATTRFDWLIPTYSLRPGVYIALAYNLSSGFATTKKFVIGSI